MARRGPLLLLAAALALPAALAAQNPPGPPPPSRTDTVLRAPRADSLRPVPRADSVEPRARAARPDSAALPDSLSPDSFSAVLPPLGPPAGPMQEGGRIVFDHDALLMSGALTLGELLQEVPGTFLVRAGWYGLPEAVHYAGQGANSVEYYVDGFALDPMGEDSAGLDPGRIAVGLFRRIEVEVLPTVLRVYLISDTQPVKRARTETSFGTGDGSTNSYRLRYLNRWPGGIGAGLGVNWFGTVGVGTGGATAARASDLTMWAKGTWAPTPRAGIEYQYLRYSLDRDGEAGVVPGQRVWRSDAFLRAFTASRDDGLGLRFDALIGSTGYGDSATTEVRRIAQGAALAGYRAARWSVEGGLRVRDERVPLEMHLRAAATPLAGLTVEAAAIVRSVLGGRSSREASFGASARPWGPLVLHGSLRLRDAIAVPAVLADTAQRAADWSAGAGLRMRRLDLDASVDRHGAWDAPAYGAFARVVPFGTVAALRTLTVSLAYRPTAYLTIAGWYRDPLLRPNPDGTGTAAYEPPHHTRLAATFHSRFLPHFRRGVFDLLVQVGAEGWSRGVMGADSTGTPVLLAGHGTIDWLVELHLLSAVIYWSFRNSQLEHFETVPGVQMARASQRYGVRWEFTN